MKKYRIRTRTKKLLADTITPVSIYLRIRDIYPNSLLLESSDYHGNENSYSFICVKSIASFEIDNGVATETYPDKNTGCHAAVRSFCIQEPLFRVSEVIRTGSRK